MAGSVEYYFSISSPWAYLGLDKIRALVAEYSLELKPFPITIIAENGAIALKSRPATRQTYWLRDVGRWARHLGKTMVMENRPTSDWVPASFMVIAAELDGLDWVVLAAALQERWWGHADDIGDAATRRSIADATGFNGATLLAREHDADVQAKWRANLERAKDKGIFGVPTYVYEDEPYWGQDSLQFLRMHLSGDMVPERALGTA